MSELDVMAEGRSTSIIVLYPLLRKVETGLGQDTLLPLKLSEECTPAADIIESSVAEAGMLLLCGDVQITGVTGLEGAARRSLPGKPGPLGAW